MLARTCSVLLNWCCKEWKRSLSGWDTSLCMKIQSYFVTRIVQSCHRETQWITTFGLVANTAVRNQIRMGNFGRHECSGVKLRLY